MKGFFQDLRNTLQPPRWDSWQTLLLMAIFSALLSSITEASITQTIISSCGWIWLILSAWWLVYEYKKQITFGFWFTGPWIIGALFAIFLSSNFPSIPRSALLILWAPLSAAIAIIPNFISTNSTTKEPEWSIPAMGKRQGMVLLILSHLLIACWVQFYFLLQNWLTYYPSLQAENLSQGNFVVNVRHDPATRGPEILKVTESELRAELKDKTWPEVERWLLETNRSMAKLQERVQASLDQRPFAPPENKWWNITGKVTGGEYNLQLTAYLQRPNTKRPGHSLNMSCQINPKTIPLPPEQIPLRTEDIDLKNVQKNLPRFKTIAKIQCDEPIEPSSGSVFQDDDSAI